MPTLQFLDSFEHGNATTTIYGATTGTPSIVTSPARTGARALQVNPTAASEYVGQVIAAGNRRVTQSFYVRFATLPSANAQLAHFVSGVNSYVWFNQATGRFAVSVTTSGLQDFGPTVQTGVWYLIDFEYNTSAATFTGTAKCNGGTQAQASSAQVAADITAARLGNTTAQTFEAFYDDWVVSLTAGDYPIGPHAVYGIVAGADGTHNITTSSDFDSFVATAFDNTTTNGYTFIGHKPMQLANTADQVIRQDAGTVTEYMEFLMENPGQAVGTAVDVRAYGTHVESAATGASLGEIRLLLADNTEVLTGASTSLIDSTQDPGTTVTTRKNTMARPAGGWDNTKVDGLKIRVGFGDNAPDVNFIDCLLEVAYVYSEVDGTGAEVTASVSLPTGSLSVPAGDTITAIVLTVTPSLPTGNLGSSQVLGVVVDATPSLPVGSVSAAGATITGVELTATPSLPTGNVGSSQVLGVVVTATPALPAGNVGSSQVLGVVVTATPSLPVGNLGSSQVLGIALTVTPSLPAGLLTSGGVFIQGVALSTTPTLPTGGVASSSLAGVPLVATPTLPAGLLGVLQVLGVALVATPTLPVGQVAFISDHHRLPGSHGADWHVTYGPEPHATKGANWKRTAGTQTINDHRTAGSGTIDDHRLPGTGRSDHH